MGDFLNGFGPQLVLLMAVVVASLAAAAALIGSRPGPFGLNKPAAVLAAGSGLAIAVATLTRRAGAHRGGYVQLEPFDTIRMYLHDGDSATSVLLYVGGNIALFAPLGFFTYLALRQSVLLTTVLCGLTSLGVEILQLPIWSRSTDVDDLICNTAGGFAGAVLAAIVWHTQRIVRQERARRQALTPSAPTGPSATEAAGPARRR